MSMAGDKVRPEQLFPSLAVIRKQEQEAPPPVNLGEQFVARFGSWLDD